MLGAVLPIVTLACTGEPSEAPSEGVTVGDDIAAVISTHEIGAIPNDFIANGPFIGRCVCVAIGIKEPVYEQTKASLELGSVGEMATLATVGAVLFTVMLSTTGVPSSVPSKGVTVQTTSSPQ